MMIVNKRWAINGRGAFAALIGVATALSLTLTALGATSRDPADINWGTALGMGPKGTIWLSELLHPYLARVDANGGLHPVQIPDDGSSLLMSSATGTDGALWVADGGGNRLLRYGPSGTLTVYPIRSGSGGPNVVTAGPDRAVWFTDSQGNRIGRMTTAGRVTVYLLPTRDAAPDYIVTGPDGALWFTETNAGKIGRIDTTGRITERAAYSAGSSIDPTAPTGIVAGPDGNLWYTEKTGYLVRLSTSWRQTPYALPSGSEPYQVVVGASKDLWIACSIGGIVHADLAGRMARFSIGAHSTIGGVAVAGDGSIWFSDQTSKYVLGRIAHGRVTRFPAPPVSFH